MNSRTLVVSAFFALSLALPQASQADPTWISDPDTILSEGGAGTGTGGFAFTNAKSMLMASCGLLHKRLTGLSEGDLPAIGGRKAELVEALKCENLIIREKTYHRRAGSNRLLQMDYDSKRMRIYVLEPFFAAYEERVSEFSTLRTIELKLLHEAAHLFGMNDDQAEYFATDVLARTDNAFDDFRLKRLNGARKDKSHALYLGTNEGLRRIRCEIRYHVASPEGGFDVMVTVALLPGSTQIADPFYIVDGRLLRHYSYDAHDQEYIERSADTFVRPDGTRYTHADTVGEPTYACEYAK